LLVGSADDVYTPNFYRLSFPHYSKLIDVAASFLSRLIGDKFTNYWMKMNELWLEIKPKSVKGRLKAYVSCLVHSCNCRFGRLEKREGERKGRYGAKN